MIRMIRGPFTVDAYLDRRKEIEREYEDLPRWAQKQWIEPHYLYRYFNDDAPIGHRLHYIGITREFVQRDEFHQWKSRWRMALPITRIEIVEYPHKGHAEVAEQLAIFYEIPCHNAEHNRFWMTTHPDGGLTPDCDPDYSRTGKTDSERRREAMDKLGELLSERARTP